VQFHPVLTQWATASVSRRVEPTEGLFVDLDVAADAPRVTPPRFDLSDVHVEFEGLEGGGFAGFFVDGGALVALAVTRWTGLWIPRPRLRSRCYSRMVGTEEDPDSIRFVPIGLQRDWAGVREVLEEAKTWQRAP
jgi:hypothetical protein